ncbi:exopolygalacturonase-like [Diospyros lotus]|uniref:exopolygalacturonase-like n=1 Tax=Diospyros lotus TaxID=55363 RepID=UPI00225A7D2C|nr:exopolygalacturonase-like [Diospyros lotus]
MLPGRVCVYIYRHDDMQKKPINQSIMASIISMFAAFFCCFLLLASTCPTDARKHLHKKEKFNVKDYGAVADGRTDDSPAFLKAWKDACQWDGKGKVWIPRGTYLLKPVTFKGPCKGEHVHFVIKGTLTSPGQLDQFAAGDRNWISFQYVEGLKVRGGGTLDGQGSLAWGYNDCSTNSDCKPLPVTMGFDFVKKGRVFDISSVNSKSTHFNLFGCDDFHLSFIRISAPQLSPNTDGIRIGSSTNVKIRHAVIGTGDDCVSVLSGSQNIDIYDVRCGPGHGISIGSLGKSSAGGDVNELVRDVTVSHAVFTGTQNGVRIKTWAPSSPGTAERLNFYNVEMQNVKNPIIIDQHYCPQSDCDSKAESSVQIKDVTFSRIWGWSSSKAAVNLQCSEAVPCQNVKLIDINLGYKGPGGGKATCIHENVRGRQSGRLMNPRCA